MNRPELLAPAGSFAAVRAAVQNGADAVYMGFGTFHARRGAKCFSPDEMADAITYCRARGVKTHLALNILVSDREREKALRDARFLYEAGADALIVQDLGLARLLHRRAPALALHASTQMTVMTLDGARLAKELGFSRVVLARETPFSEIRRITAECGIETEIFVHGALCRCYSGQCFLSSVIGRRSGNRGLCAQPCRLPYRRGGKGPETYPLSLKDLSLAEHIPEICRAGVASLKIEGRMKRPEYTAAVTRIYAALLREQRTPTRDEADTLRRVFSRDGFTDGYFTGDPGADMLGTRTELPLAAVQPLYDEAARSFSEGREAPLVPVGFSFSAGRDQPVRLTAEDGCHTVSVSGAAPEPARTRPASKEQVEKALRKTGGTPFALQRLTVEMEDGLALPAAALNALRREALQKLLACREQPPEREPWRAGAEPVPFAEVSLTVDETGLLLHLWDGVHDGVTVFDTVPCAAGAGCDAEVRRWLSENFRAPDDRLHVSVRPLLAFPGARLSRLKERAMEKYCAVLSGRRPRGTILEARSFAQLSPALLETAPAAVYLPLDELFNEPRRAQELARRVPVAAVLPRVFFDAEQPEIARMLQAVRAAGVTSAVAGNLGQIALLREHAMVIYGDFGLNAFQSDTLAALAALGVSRQTLSFELRLEQARSLLSPIETELLAYGYLPLMIFERCAIRRKDGRCTCRTGPAMLTDRTGRAFPLVPEYGCRNSLLNSVPLAVPPEELYGMDFLRLRFTVEPPEECARVARAFARQELPAFAGGSTRGLYRRGAE